MKHFRASSNIKYFSGRYPPDNICHNMASSVPYRLPFKGRAEDDRYYWINAENDGLGIADINDPKGWLTDDDKQVIADTWSKLQSGEIKDYLPEDIQ